MCCGLVCVQASRRLTELETKIEKFRKYVEVIRNKTIKMQPLFSQLMFSKWLAKMRRNSKFELDSEIEN